VSRGDLEPTGFKRIKQRAELLLVQSQSNVQSVLRDARKKLFRTSDRRIVEIREDLITFIQLCKSWLSGDYRDISKSAIVSLLAAIMYFLIPFDVLPDFIFGFGYLDDVAVARYVLKTLRGEIEAFRLWQRGQGIDETDRQLVEDLIKGTEDEDDRFK
tara:strand:- start:71 stop:544 length:474 start_codon:yes stop_codon:yes gene_type:complete